MLALGDKVVVKFDMNVLYSAVLRRIIKNITSAN